jgi:hypothetical protein
VAVPLAARWVAAACGVLLILGGWQSIIGTLIVPRPVGSWLTRMVDHLVVAAYMAVTRPITDWVRRDRILATQAAAILVVQLGAWLGILLVGFTLLLWPSGGRSITAALTDAGSSIFTLGFAEPLGTTPAVIVFIAAASGMVVVALQIGYLPTLYSAFNRRETEVTLLTSVAGVPSWGPELLARTHYALGSGMSTLDTLPDLYRQWQRWSSDVAESHTTYLPLVRFRSPQPYSSWVIALLSVLDSAGPRRHAEPTITPRRPPSGRQRGGLAARPAARVQADTVRIHDLSIIPTLCWPHDRGVAQRRRAAGVADLPADELTPSCRAQPAAAAGLRAHATGVRGARAAQRGA